MWLIAEEIPKGHDPMQEPAIKQEVDKWASHWRLIYLKLDAAPLVEVPFLLERTTSLEQHPVYLHVARARSQRAFRF